VPVVAWCFNIGALVGGVKARLARIALSRINRFVVHSRRECDKYSDWLRIPRERFRFVHLQRPLIPLDCDEEKDGPFLLAMGSAHRDYATLFDAIRPLGIKTIVVTATHALNGLDVPACVEILSNLTSEECYRLAQRARVNVVPIANDTTASGQVTVVEAMCLGRPLIATRCVGTEDYIEHNVTGMLVKGQSVAELREAIMSLWGDAALRNDMANRAREFAATHFSDEAAAGSLVHVLDEVEESLGR
jgi:glycosyltransferase involved in cell wall biosynthesis